jgi:assimilatory nitrate reductase catalytic subunit
MSAVATTCPYCGVGCGLKAARAADGSYEIRGDPAHPANLGRICSKGAALGDTLGLEGRLLHPEIRGARATWDEALDTVARGFADAIATHGPESVAFYVSGQLLTEDYYVANKLMKGFIGSANIDTNSRLCMASAVAGYKRAFGADFVPNDYTDLEHAELVVLVGSNLAWCHPVLFQRLSAAKTANPKLRVVVVDPRRTQTCCKFDRAATSRCSTGCSTTCDARTSSISNSSTPTPRASVPRCASRRKARPPFRPWRPRAVLPRTTCSISIAGSRARRARSRGSRKA